MEKEMKSPRCSRVVLVDSTRTAQGHTVFKFSIDAEHAITGFIAKTEGDNYMIWRPYIRSSTQSGYWNAGPMKQFVDGYKSEEDAMAVLIDEVQDVLWGD